MGIYELLSQAIDTRKGGNACDFNGYLEDYLEMVEEGSEISTLLHALFEADNDLKICVNYRIGLSENSISNLIIRYKDINKLDEKPLKCPYIVYTKKDGQEKAILLASEYIYAKGLYYCATESGSVFEGCKNDIIALDTKNVETVVGLLTKVFGNRAGYLQRDIDRKTYANYDVMFEHALSISENVRNTIFDTLKEVEDKSELIKQTVVNWFLLKKYVYVQYMVDKNLLTTRHEGNTKAQRNQAKQNADAIRFISMPELYKGKLSERTSK